MNWPSFAEIAESVRCGRVTALSLTERALTEIRQHDHATASFTRVLADQARAAAAAVDAQAAAGRDPGPLAGVPFGVKDLFDLAGLPTTAGARTRLTTAPAKRDAVAVQRLKAAGAVLVGTLNMDEFAYGFATVNAHFGTTRNPHDRQRLAGGSSGGSAAAVAAGLVPLSLGSDTNGSIRVPAALCGIWGLRPADGAISTEGVFPLAESLDTAGPFARSAADLERAFAVLAERPADPVATSQPRVKRLGGWFVRNATTEVLAALDLVAAHLGVIDIAPLESAEAARSASFLITAAEAGAQHAASLSRSALDYDPAVRDRLLAGTRLPAAILLRAQHFRGLYRAEVASLWRTADILIAPATPVVAPLIEAPSLMLDGKPAPARANLGLYTQPLSLAGMTVVAAPVAARTGLPVGLQFAAAPGREAMLFSLLRRLEQGGVLATRELDQS